MKQDRCFKFTDNKITKIKLTGDETYKQIEYTDLASTGLKLVHSTLSDRKKFYHRYTIAKQKKRMLLGEFPAISVEKARQMVDRNKVLIAEGRDPVKERGKVLLRPTVKDFCDSIYVDLITNTKKSYKEDLRKLHKDILPCFGDMVVEEIRTSDVMKYLGIIQKRASNATANRHRALLSHLMNTAKQHDLIVKNPVLQVKKYTERTSYGRSLTNEEQHRLFATLKECTNRLSALAIKLLLLTGMRKTECLSVKYKNIDLEDGYILLEESDTKAGKERKVYLNEKAIHVVNELRKCMVKRNPYLFPGNQMGKHLTTVRKTFEKCKEIAGIQNFRLHDCRHNFCSTLSEKNVPAAAIQELMGHSSLAMTQRYIHQEQKKLQAYSNRVADSFAEVV